MSDPQHPTSPGEPDRPATPRWLPWVVVLAVLVVLVPVLFLALGGSDDTDDEPRSVATDPSAERSVPDPGAKRDTPPAGATADFGLVVGDPDAARSVVVYEDFLCPFCGELEKTVNDRVDAAVEAGDLTVEYRPLAFLERISDYSPDAANAFAVVLDSAGPEVAKDFHDLLYAQQPSESGPFPDDDDLVSLAVEAGADEAVVRPGIENDAFGAWVDQATQAALDAGVSATPTVLVDGEPAQAQTIEELADEIIG